jgi:anti-sigma B factor antagonist
VFAGEEVAQMLDGGFRVEMVGGVPVVTAPEEVDITNAPRLRSALLEAAARGHGALVVDMTRTRFCDCAGLHTLLAAHKRAQAEDGGLLLIIRGTSALRVFELTGLDRVIPSFTSLDEAVAQTSADGSSSRRQADDASGTANRTGSARSMAPADLVEAC